MTAKSLPGARESSAGDEFHVVWAVRRVLSLLDPTSELQRVVMEDLTPVPPEGVDPELLLGVDLTEFYGGVDLADADRVVVSQLKYSHRHPDKTWTAARLAARGSRGGKGVIARLADVYKGVSASSTRDRIFGRLEIRLVSNQPCSKDLLQALDAAQGWLADRPGQVRRADLVRSLESDHGKEIQHLFDASHLRSSDFTDFLRVLDLSHVGTESRADQDLRVTRALSAHVMTDLRHASLQIFDLVRTCGLPEGEGRPIERADVLAALDVHSEEALFPAPSRIAKPKVRVRTPDAARVVAALSASPDRRVLAHGNAGVGKTTTITSLEDELPRGSLVITYDCFGEGDYETPAAGRHDPIRFAQQLCNELAVRCRLPLLLRPSSSVHDLWGELQRRVEAAASVLAENGAQLVVVVDAADNSAWAARRFDERSFVDRLWAQPFPGASLVVTCRKARRGLLNAPPEVNQVELTGFDAVASAAFLRTRFPDAGDQETVAFHDYSRGIPRVQFYSLFEARAGAAGTLAEAIEQAKQTPDDLFESLFVAAVKQTANAHEASDRMAELVCLTKPLTTTRFRNVSGMAADRVRDFCDGLVPGVVIDGDEIAFRDEDFANYLRKKVGGEQETRAHGRLADLFLGQPADPAAATVVADHLHNAGRYDDLVELALAGPPEGIPDGLTRQQLYRRRLTLAMRRAATVSDRLAACKLVVLAAEAARHGEAVSEILRRRPDLGMQYSDPEAVMRVYLTSSSEAQSRGPVHMQLAGTYARFGDHARGQTEGESAWAWLRRLNEGGEHWTVTADDAGALAEAKFHIDGPDAAEQQLRRWVSKDFALEAADALVRRLALSVPGEDLGQLIEARSLPAEIRARLLAKAYVAGAAPSAASVHAIASDTSGIALKLESADGSWVSTFVELAAHTGIERHELLDLLEALELPQPRSAPSRFSGAGDYHDFVRVVALRMFVDGQPLKLDRLMPLSVTNPKGGASGSRIADSDRRNMHENVGRYLDVFALRARCLLIRPPVTELRTSWDEGMRGGSRDRGDEPDYGYRTWVVSVVDSVLASTGADTALVNELADSVAEISGDSDAHCWLAMARRLVRDDRYRREGLKLIERAASAIEAAEMPASQQADFLLEACGVAHPVDAEQARDLHIRAIRAAEGVDDATIGRLDFHAEVAADLFGVDAAAGLAWRTAEVLVSQRLRVNDDEHLPWVKTLRAVARLHPQTALALAARWEDSGYFHLWESVPALASALGKSGFLTPRQALAILPLAGEEASGVGAAVDLLERMSAGPDRNAALGWLSYRVRRDLRPDARARAAHVLAEWADARGYNANEAVRLLRPYRPPPSRPEANVVSGRFAQEQSEREQRADEIVAAASTMDIENLEADLAELAKLYVPDRIPAYLEAVADGLVPSQRIAFIATLGALGADHSIMRLHAGDVLAALVDAATRWKTSHAVREISDSATARLVETHFVNLTRYDLQAKESLQGLLAFDVLDDAPGLILHAVGEKAEELDASTLFAIGALLAQTLAKSERASLLDWSLRGLEENVPVIPNLENDRSEVLASFIWSLLGAPDKAVRWRAAHVARDLAALVSGFGEVLFRQTSRKRAGPYGSATLPFHWLSAQAWAFMVIARVAKDAPAVVASVGPQLAGVALNEDWPHASIREFARRAALRIHEGIPGALESQTAENLRFANRPRACRAERAEHFDYRTGDGNREYDTERFHFSIDALPYVYGPFGSKFGLGVDDIADRGERWIIDRLGVGSDRYSDVRLGLLEGPQKYSYHGESPRGESWHQMLEEHALLLAAGELCDEGAPIVMEEEGSEDPWSDWLGNWTDVLEHGWLSDERIPVPPEPTLLLRDVDRSNWLTLTESSLAGLLCVEEDSQGLVVDAAIELSTSFGFGSTKVTSALVAPETAPALQRALEGAEPGAFSLPLECGYRYSEQANITSGAFRLEGWISHEESDGSGLETHDPLRRLAPTVTRPGSRFVDVCGGVIERGGRAIRGSSGLVAWQNTWSDIDDVTARRGESIGAQGSQTIVSRQALGEFLRATAMILVIKVWASRHTNKNSHQAYEEADDGTEEREQRVQRVFLFDPEVGLME